MTKGNSDTAMRAELVRLLTGLEFYRAWVIADLERVNGTVTQDDLNNIVEDSSVFLGSFDAATARGRASVLKDLQQWYAHTADRLTQVMGQGNAPIALGIRQFLDAFRQETGFDLLAEAGFYQKLLAKVRKRGAIRSDAEYERLVEIEASVDLHVLSPDETAELATYLRRFEADQVTRN